MPKTLKIRELTEPQVRAFGQLFPGIAGAVCDDGTKLVTTTKSTIAISLNANVRGLAEWTGPKAAAAGRVIAERRGIHDEVPIGKLLAKLESAVVLG